ncbi:hypothetical protein UlMin_013654 [Ulmus minor]
MRESFSALAADTPWDNGTTWSTMDFYTLTLHIPLSFGWIYVELVIGISYRIWVPFHAVSRHILPCKWTLRAKAAAVWGGATTFNRLMRYAHPHVVLLVFGFNISIMSYVYLFLAFKRIAIAYLVAALCEIWLKGDNNVNSGSSLLKNYRFQWAVALILSTIYLALLYGLKVPDWEYHIPIENSTSPASTSFFVKCGVRGDTGLACNAVGMIGRKILGIQHLYRKLVYARSEQCSINSPDSGPLPMDAPSWCQVLFDLEGLLSSVMAIVTCLIGLHFGHIIVHFKDHKNRILQWMIPSLGLLILGLNKPLYSLSYMCVTSAATGILFVVIYLLLLIFWTPRCCLVLELWFNSILYYNVRTLFVHIVACFE